jgi:carboxypeptidase Q
MKLKFPILFILIAAGLNVFAQPISKQQQYQNDSTVVSRLATILLTNSTGYEDLRILCKTIGHRLSGSTAAAKAVEWGKNTLINAGCDRVYLQPVLVPKWVRGQEEAQVIMQDGQKLNLEALGLGNAVGTTADGLEAKIVEVRNMEELEQLGVENISGKIVFFNHEWRQGVINPFKEYGGCVEYRWAGPSKAAKYGAVGVIIRSAGSGYDNFAHTGSMRYDTLYNKIPAMAISYLMAEKLQRMVRAKQIRAVRMFSNSHFEPDVLSYNVIGELTGTDAGKEIITIGGHLDSWDVGEGAHDDGAGVVQSIDVLRAFKKLGIKPRRTVRCVLFMNEENGLRGGKEYARVAKLNKENHILAIETDAGGSSPRGFSLSMDKTKKEKVLGWKNIFYPLGVYDFAEEGGGADIGPLQQAFNTPLMGLEPDPQNYFDLHHTNKDVFEEVNRRELTMGSVAIAAMVYMVCEHGL